MTCKQTTLTSENRLVIQGSNFRYEDNHPSWFLPAGTLHQRSQILVSNGTVAKTFFPKGMTGDRDAVGIIQAQTWHSMATSYVYQPVMLAFRGLEPSLAAYDVRRLKPAGLALSVGGVPCSRFELGSASSKETFWIDDAGLLRRRQHESKGQLSSQCDVRYDRRYGLESFPVSWTIVQYSPAGSARIEITIDVLDATVNPEIASREFEVRFPSGCKVRDLKFRKEYVVQPDGSMRESNPPKGQSPETRSQDEPGFLSRHRVWFGGSLALAVVLLLGGYVLRRRWRKQ